ncbi:aldo/keto reductase, putative [Talaromyces stipitatus ATCC 10500]|uniref:Aldo/keto reductase, putative n=1 Tax=Talaromyces stipitatus (strain ATCC 10500 / CBS 375.48 / QM 6759 / NRRL 1006) TaxID=441959 RepID=B8LZ46_TALSN|nr:aldo/keto reductase, putative [Talaromyces stipitatus ATCC 10500]EED21090.1 aldo/keto reductase, putative [Talaromyces stipitatus ATCC 10500]
MFIKTQCSSWVDGSPKSRARLYREKCAASKDFVNQGGLPRKALFSAVDASLRRLGVEYIDLLQIHSFDYNTPVEEIMEPLHDLVNSDKVRYIGASSVWTYQFAMMQFCAEKNGWTKFISMQNHYNLLCREEREMKKFCNETGVGLIPWAPPCRGYIARPVSSPQPSDRTAVELKMGRILSVGQTETDHAIINRVEEIVQKKGWKMSTVALA